MTLFGYGNTTKAIAKKLGYGTFFDDKVHKPFVDEDGFKLQPSSEFNAKYSNIEIPSPGIPPHHPLIQQARHLVSDYDYFFKEFPPSVWISGTNGKTTTTQMIEFLLNDKNVQAGGNIGKAVAEMDRDKSLWILETSSYTLHYTNIATPDIYILLPITPDHLSWHGSMQAYEEAKLSPLKRMKEGDIAIIPKKFEGYASDAHIIYYENSNDIAEYFGFDTASIEFEGAFLTDALLAMAVDKILFDRSNYAKMNEFKLDAHRQEKIEDKQGRLWINDSKATNIDATVELLKLYSSDDTVHIILGGDDKGVELDSLFEHLKQYKHITLFLIGKNADRLEAMAKAYSIPYFQCGTLSKAVEKIDTLHTTSSVAMLSPAAASLDQFNSYVHRGETFRDGIQTLS